MKTGRVSKILKVLLLVLSFVAIISLYSCDDANSTKTVLNANIINVPHVLYVEEFDPQMNNIRNAVNASGIKLGVEYDDGTTDEIPLEFDMLEDVFKQQLNAEGIHNIAYTYKGVKTGFEVIVQRSRTYTVRFWGPDKTIISEQKVVMGASAKEPSEAERAIEGYDFIGWTESFNKVTRDMDIHGSYQKKTYVVTFCDFVNGVLSTQTVTHGGSATAPKFSEIPGYEFIKWDNTFSDVTSDLTVNAVYKQKSYTVRFYDNDGNLISEQSVLYGTSAIAPQPTDITGYDFVGWDMSFANVTSDLTVNAVYEQKSFTVQFYDNEGKLISEQTVVYGMAAVEPSEAEMEREGYRFVDWSCEFNYVTEDIKVYGIYEVIGVAVNFYNCNNVLIATKFVAKGGTVEDLSDEEKYTPGYIFLSWDRELTNITEDTDIYGAYINDNVTDTDGDGIIDYIEIEVLGLDYTKVDTDGDGILDGDEDFDNDGLSNIYEITNFLKPNNADTDGDGLIDGDEINIYWTLPLDPDTDGDGASDGWEVDNKFDPTIYNKSFEVKVEVSMPDNTQIKVDIPELPGEYVGTTIIEQSENNAIKDVHGSIGAPINYNASASASITIVSDEATKAADPVLMYFNTKTNQVEPISVTVSGNEVTANITQYGSYVLVDRKVFEEKGQWRDVFDAGKYSSIEIVFVVDDSGSMSSNDGSYKRLSVAIDLINNLPADAKVGVILFDSSVQALTSSLTTKDIAKTYLTRTYFNNSGNTKLYSGAMRGLGLFSAKQDNDGVMRIMILLSDGQPTSDSYNQTNVINGANAKGVKIYTVGLGNSTSAFNSCLKPLSNGTDGQYYHSSNASQLQSIYDNIGETIDMSADDDGDGISNFFESGVDKNGVPTLPTINGMDFMGLDKNNPDTDGDGYLDGEEIEVYLYYSTTKPGQVMVWGIVNSNPLDPTSVPAAQ